MERKCVNSKAMRIKWLAIGNFLLVSLRKLLVFVEAAPSHGY